MIAGKYRLERVIGAGGMGSIWAAHHVELDVEVALKFLARPGELNPEAIQRFKSEAQAAARIKSPHVVHIYDFGIDAGAPYIAMELCSGEDLGQHLDRVGRLSLGSAAALVRQIGKGLESVHRAGIVHRDVKPKNLFLARCGNEEVLKLLDFGIAKRIQLPGTSTSASASSGQSANTVLGSPAYMSPEQARGGTVNEASDVWALGAVVYRALTGVLPFVGSNAQETVIKICTERPEPATRLVPELPREIDAFFEKALAPRPEARFMTALELAHELSELAARHGSADITRRPVAPVTREAMGRSSTTEVLLPALPPKGFERRRWLPLGLGLGGLVLALGFAGWLSSLPDPSLATKRAPPLGEKPAPKPNPKLTLPHIQARAEPAPVSEPPAKLDAPVRVREPRAPRKNAEPLERLDPVFGLPLSTESTPKAPSQRSAP